MNTLTVAQAFLEPPFEGFPDGVSVRVADAVGNKGVWVVRDGKWQVKSMIVIGPAGVSAVFDG